MEPPLTFNPPLAVRLAPLPMVNVPLLEVTAPLTEPAPFQLPPVTPRVLLIAPLQLIVPLPVSVALPSTEPVPVSVPAVKMLTTCPLGVEPVRFRVPALMLVGPE